MSPSPSPAIGAKLLLADDNRVLRSAYAVLLRRAGYRVLEASDGVEAVELWEREDPALIVLDVSMPRMDGWQTLERLKLRGCRRPTLMLTALDQVEDRVKGLAAGADDYVGKPCDIRELNARVQALLRRSERGASGLTVLHFGDITVDLVEHTVFSVDGRPVPFTRTEFAIMDLLARHYGRAVSRDMILDGVWGYTNRPNTRTVETHIWRMRGKLGDAGEDPRWIRTVLGAGYRLECDPQPVAA
jgi:two-component system response regulator MprA